MSLFSNNSAFRLYESPLSENLTKSFLGEKINFPYILNPTSFFDFLQGISVKEQINQTKEPTDMNNEKNDELATDSVDNIMCSDVTSISQIIDNKNELPKKRKNKEETKLEIQQKNKDEGRGGNCIASNITKTLIRVSENRLQDTLRLKFKALIEKYKIKSQKENTIIILLILYDLVKSSQLSIFIFENIFSCFMKSLNESKQNCEKKMTEEPERRGFHLKNRKMYVNFININRQIYSKLVTALREDETVKMDLKQISEIISDTYDRKQRQIQKALSKLKSIILNHDSLKGLFEHEGYENECTLLDAIDYAYRRNLDKRRNQAKKRVQRLINEVRTISDSLSQPEQFFMCYCALKLVGEKEQEIWEQFVKSTLLKREYNQSRQQGERINEVLREEIPAIFSGQEQMRRQVLRMNQESPVKIEQQSNGLRRIFMSYMSLKNDMDI